MRLLIAITALLLFCSAAVGAHEEVLRFRTCPGGSIAYEITPQGELPHSPVSDRGREAEFAIAADVAAQHRFVLRRAHFDDMQLEVRWMDSIGKWQKQRETSSFDVLQIGELLSFSKTLRIHSAPPPTDEFVEVSERQKESVEVGGSRIDVAPLPRTADGQVVVPDAYHPPKIVLRHAAFAPLLLTFREGELDADGTEFPKTAARFRPLYGPFSYWQFNVATAAWCLIALVVWAVVLRPAAAKRQAENTRQLTLAARLMQQAEEMQAASPLPPMMGRTLFTEGGEEFIVGRKLGQGAMGGVFEALPSGHTRPASESWAVKVLFRDVWNEESSRVRFQREATVCSKLSHPNIVTVLDWGLYKADDGSGGWPFIIMELLSGRELRSILHDDGQMDARQALQWGLEMMRGLKVAHLAGIIHRDIKPENIMITESNHVKIMDFGIAREIKRDNLTQTGLILGTPAYMSPEHGEAKTVVPASDIYSCGVVMYEMLAGHIPFEADNPWAIFMRVLTEEPEPLVRHRPDIPGRLSATVMKMLARDLSQRYTSADEVIVDLEAVRFRS